MAGQSGTTWLLGVRTTGGASPLYTIIAGLRSRSFKLNSNPVDATTADSPGRWRELLGDTGTVEMEVDAAGLYQKDAPTHLLPTLAASGASTVFALTSASSSAGMFIVGSFVVSEYETTATYNEAVSFTVKLVSTTAPTFNYNPSATVPG